MRDGSGYDNHPSGAFKLNIPFRITDPFQVISHAAIVLCWKWIKSQLRISIFSIILPYWWVHRSTGRRRMYRYVHLHHTWHISGDRPLCQMPQNTTWYTLPHSAIPSTHKRIQTRSKSIPETTTTQTRPSRDEFQNWPLEK